MMEQKEVIEKIKEGLELFRRRNFIDAEATFRQVVGVSPDSFYGWFHLGRTLFYLNKKEEARDAFQRALQKNLQLANTWINTGRFCDQSTGYQTEESCLTEHLFEHERDADIRKLLAEVFYDIRSIVTREHCFEEKAISETGASGERKATQTIIARRNCQVTTH